MSRPVDELVMKYRDTGVLVDSNLLLLLFVGAYRKSLISSFKRLSDRFVTDDYEVLVNFLELFRILITTPNVLTEVSNLCGQLPENEKPKVYATFEFLTSRFTEQYFPTMRVLQDSEFRLLGVTDAAIRLAAEAPLLVLTDDFRLSGKLSMVPIDVLNFNHLRSYFGN